MTFAAKSKLARLMTRIERVAEVRGKKAELARFLGVIPQQVHNWIAGRIAPNGEVTLLMLEWVEAEEANQQRGRSGATNTTAAKTRERQHSHAKPKTGRHKK